MPEAVWGDLSYLRIATLIQCAESETWTGVLQAPQDASLTFYQGSVVDARFGYLKGRMAAKEIFFLEEGIFSLSIQPVKQTRELIPMVPLIMEGSRLVDEWKRVAASYLSSEPGSELPPSSGDFGRVLSRLDGKMRLRTAVASVGCPRAMVVDPIHSLLEQGFLVEVGPPQMTEDPLSPNRHERAGPTPQLLELVAELLAEGRVFFRKGCYDEAEACFREALDLLPEDRIARQNLQRLQQIRDGFPPFAFRRT